MKEDQLPLGAIAFAVLIAGLAFAGVPKASLWFLLLVFACPLIMMFMMRGMSGMAETAQAGPR